MRLFCPNCGQPNEATAGTPVTCTACATKFEPPTMTPPPPASGWQQPPIQPPPAQVWQPPHPVQPAPTAWPSEPVMGTPVLAQPANPKTNTLAIVSLVTSLICCLAPFTSVAAVATGILALKQIEKDPNETGKGLAIAGIVVGALSIAGALLFFILALIGSQVPQTPAP